MFNVGLYAAAKTANVLETYAAAVLRRDLHRWHSEAPYVRRLLVLPATAYKHALVQQQMGCRIAAQIVEMCTGLTAR